ncbi:MAG: hypothetical protein N2484_00080 [Clostridia bacterium]|nr:hypothetical protein [Clostridia bacterium]
MMRNSRRPYISAPQPEQPSITVSNLSQVNEESLKALIVDSLKALSRNIDELKQSMKEIEDKLDYLDSRQRKIEGDLERSATKSRAAELDLHTLRTELEAYRKGSSYPTYSPESPENMDRPMMPGTGFACVTPNYLRGKR